MLKRLNKTKTTSVFLVRDILAVGQRTKQNSASVKTLVLHALPRSPKSEWLNVLRGGVNLAPQL